MSPARLLPLLIGSLGFASIAHAVQTPTFSHRGGTVWVSGHQNELTIQRDGGPAQTVWKNENPLQDGVQAGPRLVFSNWDTLTVFPADSWTPRVTTLPSGVTALAAATNTALAVTSGEVWRLKPDGTWSQHATGIKDHIIDLAHHRGTWVAVGSTIGESVSDDDGPDRHHWPHWELSELERRIYWSADGLTWKPAQLPPPAEGDPYGQILAVAGHAEGWLALGAEGETYTSKDGRTWQPAGRLSDITPNTRLHLHALGQRFWAQVTNEEYSHDWCSTTDGITWTDVPLAPSASIVALFMKSGEVHALGTRKSGRSYETAPVAAFGEIPSPNQAELLAQRAAEDEKRLAAEAKLLAEQRLAEAKASEVRASAERLAALPVSTRVLEKTFHGTPVGFAWDGQAAWLLSSGGLYRSADATAFILWAPFDRVGFTGMTEIDGTVWVWSAIDSEPTSRLWRVPPWPATGLVPVLTAQGRLTALAGSGDTLLALTESGPTTYAYLSDDAGKTWRLERKPVGDVQKLEYAVNSASAGPDLAYGNGRWVAIGRRADNTTVAAVSTDRLTWRTVPVGGPARGMMRVVFAGGRFHATGHLAFAKEDWTIASSTDGESWQLTALRGEAPGLLDATDGRVWAANKRGVFTTDDGRTWKQVATHEPIQPTRVARLGGNLVILGSAGVESDIPRREIQLVQLPAPSASEIAAVPDAGTQALAAALEKFDLAVGRAPTVADYAAPAAALLTALDRHADHKFGDAFCQAMLSLLHQSGGARGYFDFQMAVSSDRLATASTYTRAHLTPAQKEIIKGLASKYSQPSLVVDTRSWPTSTRKPVEPQTSDAFSLPEVRRAIAGGSLGALFDLVLAHSQGMGTAKDAQLQQFWASVFNRLTTDLPKENEALKIALSARGSAYYSGTRALGELDAGGWRMNDSILAALERAAAGGWRAAAAALNELSPEIAERKKGRTFDDLYAASDALNRQMIETMRGLAKDIATMSPEDATKSAAIAAQALSTLLAESVGAREGAVERLRLKDVSQSLTDVAHVAGLYVATGDKGTLFFSTDARQWEPVKVSDGAGLGRVLHDGRDWFVPSRQGEWGVFSSSDRRIWALSKRWILERRSVVVRNGAFWKADFGLAIASYRRGRLDAAHGHGDIQNWDGQIGQWSNSPFAVFTAGDRFGLVTEKGDIFTSDNGDYWERVGRHSFTKPDAVAYAAGNGVELLAAWKFDARGSAELLAHTGDGAWRSVAPPFRNLAGIAYGLGRFVALGTTRVEGQWDLYESTDGTTWKSVASVVATAGDLAFGPAGFLATGANGSLVLYNPAPLPAKPMPQRASTPIPPVTFPDYATGDAPASTGKGRGPRPLSPQERATDELRSLVGKAETGNIVAQRTLAFAMSPGGPANPNPWRAELWFKDALTAGDPQAGRGYAVLLRQWKPDTPFARLEELHQASADRGDETAKTWVAQRKTYVANLAQAQSGDPAAIMAVAPLLIAGDVVDVDRTKALNWVYRAAEKNHTPALRFLLQNHAQELTDKVAKPRRTLSDETYLEFLGKLAATGDMPALRELANGRATGANGIPKDDALAYATALKLAQLGDAEAMAFVGGALLDGRSVAKDEAAGRAWITQAADKGNAGAKQWLAQQAAVAERAKTRPPLDGRVAGLTPEVFAALESIQAAAATDLADADSWVLAKAVWADAEYSVVEEDLAQELAAAKRPLALAAADGRTLSFTKQIPVASAAGFAQVFPVAYQPGNAQYHTALWQRTISAGVLVALTRQSPQMKTMIQQGVVQELWGMLNQPAPKDKQAILAYTKQLMESDAAASAPVQKEFRALLRAAYSQARLAADQTGKTGFIGLGKLPWD